MPYGAFQDSTNQTAASTTAAYAITLNTTDYSNGVYVSNSSRVNVRNAGVYNLQFSIQFKNTTNSSQDIDVWFRKNGTDIAASKPAVPSVITTVNYISPNASENIYVSAQQQGQATVSHWANSTSNKMYGYIIVG